MILNYIGVKFFLALKFNSHLVFDMVVVHKHMTVKFIFAKHENFLNLKHIYWSSNNFIGNEQKFLSLRFAKPMQNRVCCILVVLFRFYRPIPSLYEGCNAGPTAHAVTDFQRRKFITMTGLQPTGKESDLRCCRYYIWEPSSGCHSRS